MLYCELLTYSQYKRLLVEERLNDDDIIHKANEYHDYEETRASLNTHLTKLASEIRKNKYVKNAQTNPSEDTTRPGLSTYVNISFKNPDGLTKKEIKDFYHYALRFSDHKDRHKNKHKNRNKNDKMEVQIVGKTVKDVLKDGLQEFNDSISSIQQRITEFEIKKFGKPITFVNKNSDKTESIKLRIKESVSLDERLEEIGYSTYMTDLTSDIVNWLLNKPKPYRVLYDSMYDVWSIADATATTHKDMSIDMFDSDYLYNIARDLDSDIEAMRKEGNFNSGYTDAEVYSDYLFDSGYLTGLIFIPSGDDYFKYEDTGFYPTKTEITTGTIFTKFPLEDRFKSLYRKLKIADAIVKGETTLQDIWNSTKNYVQRWYVFSERAADAGFPYNEIDKFLDDVGETRHRGVTGGNK